MRPRQALKNRVRILRKQRKRVDREVHLDKTNSSICELHTSAIIFIPKLTFSSKCFVVCIFITSQPNCHLTFTLTLPR